MEAGSALLCASIKSLAFSSQIFSPLRSSASAIWFKRDTFTRGSKVATIRLARLAFSKKSCTHLP